jgi:hypothetical protein
MLTIVGEGVPFAFAAPDALSGVDDDVQFLIIDMLMPLYFSTRRQHE